MIVRFHAYLLVLVLSSAAMLAAASSPALAQTPPPGSTPAHGSTPAPTATPAPVFKSVFPGSSSGPREEAAFNNLVVLLQKVWAAGDAWDNARKCGTQAQANAARIAYEDAVTAYQNAVDQYVLDFSNIGYGGQVPKGHQPGMKSSAANQADNTKDTFDDDAERVGIAVAAAGKYKRVPLAACEKNPPGAGTPPAQSVPGAPATPGSATPAGPAPSANAPTPPPAPPAPPQTKPVVTPAPPPSPPVAPPPATPKAPPPPPDEVMMAPGPVSAPNVSNASFAMFTGPSFSTTGPVNNADLGPTARAKFGNGFVIGGEIDAPVMPGVDIGVTGLYSGGFSVAFSGGSDLATGSAHADTILFDTKISPFEMTKTAPIAGFIRPVFGFGIGPSIDTMGTLTGHSSGIATGTGAGETKTSFAVQAEAALVIDMPTSGLSASIGYDYVRLGNFSTTSTYNLYSGPSITRPPFDVNVAEHVIKFSLTYHIGGPPQ
jgi:hypothetical protein